MRNNQNQSQYGDVATVTYWRVQGCEGNNSSKGTVIVNNDGRITIQNHGKNLNISAYTDEHARYFQDIRGENSYIIAFEVPKWFDDFVQEYTISQKKYNSNPRNQRGMAPKRVDPKQPGYAYELPPPWVEWLEEYAMNARVIQ